jgi:FkbM family methyltransferase
MLKQKAKEWLGHRAKEWFESRGYSLRKRSMLGGDPFIDMKDLMGDRNPVIFDVGSNEGQSIEFFRSHFRALSIHAFEPSAKTFSILESKHSATPGVVRLNNFGLGSFHESREFVENTEPGMSSFLAPGRDSWGEIALRSHVNLQTLDDYASLNQISHIDILKSDTQGFELEVLKGAERMMREHRIRMIYVELIISEMYQGMPRFDELLRFLLDRGFVLISIYEVTHRDGRAAWTDALFLDPRFGS